MKIKKINRKFKVGKKHKVTITEVASIKLKSNEQIVFSEKNKKYDFVKKNWGYYATPSMNFRLKKNGYRSAIIINKEKRLYLFVIDKNKIRSFKRYCLSHKLKVYMWLDIFK